jgi:hypothetical protein
MKAMKKIRGIRCHWIWIWLPTVGRQVIPNSVRATDWLMISLFEFAELIAKPPALVGRQIGAFGLTSGFGEFHRVLRSQVSTTRAIKSATQRIKEEDRRPPVRECPRTPRPKVLAGFLARGISASALFIRQICRGHRPSPPNLAFASGFIPGFRFCRSQLMPLSMQST